MDYFPERRVADVQSDGGSSNCEVSRYIWPFTTKIDMATWRYLKFDRATWTLATATWGPKI